MIKGLKKVYRLIFPLSQKKKFSQKKLRKKKIHQKKNLAKKEIFAEKKFRQNQIFAEKKFHQKKFLTKKKFPPKFISSPNKNFLLKTKQFLQQETIFARKSLTQLISMEI